MTEEQPKKEMVMVPKAVARDAAAVLGSLTIASVNPQALPLIAFLRGELESAPVIEAEEGPEE